MKLEPFATGKVESTLVTPFGSACASQPVDRLRVFVGEGVQGDRHAGTRLSDARETVLQHIGVGREVPVANVRQYSAISVEDLIVIGSTMGTPSPIPHGALGENLVVSGIPDFSQLPPGTILTFAKGDVNRKAALAVWAANPPCGIPHRGILETFGGEDTGFTPKKAFGSAAQGIRGVVGFVYCSGQIKPGDTITAWTP